MLITNILVRIIQLYVVISSNSCVCETGYELARGTCEDIDECLDDPCSDTERCSNIEGLFAMTVNFDQT